MLKILVLEDDILFSQTLEDFLCQENFEVHLVYDGQKALELSYENVYDLYLFDINLPDLNGLDLLKILRKNQNTTPCIYLTSFKDKDTLKQSYINGCDDYLKKPIDLDELLLRIKSVLKRSGNNFDTLVLKDNITFDPNTKRLYKNNIDMNVSFKVIKLLELFLNNKHNIITKDMIIAKLWNFEDNYSNGAIRVYIHSLKKILGKNSIQSIKGFGYKIEL